ncbi:MAG: class I SAM-dependent methyltransferase [Rudanella sp.]|nr:class I SAM-dependent methyltransferase [Rudanella sp.]
MTQEIIQNCPICQHTTFKPYIVCKDYLVSQDEFTIQNCEECGFRFTDPRPDSKSIGSYYQSTDYVSHNDKSGGLVNKLYRLVRQFTLRQKLNLINSIQPEKGKLLDIGCGTGLFLETCQQGGWSVEGVEPDGSPRSAAADRLKKAVVETIHEVGEESYNIITMWHVLEHVPNLQETINELKNLLQNGGTLLLALPNSDSYDAKHFKQYWAAYDIPRHLSHFTPESVNRLVTQAGFTLAAIRPMYFDSFYIGMLSTRHRDGQTNWIESIFQGIRSNWSGSKTGNYSSLIYMFKKD